MSSSGGATGGGASATGGGSTGVTRTARSLSSAEEQDRLLDEATHKVKRAAFYMKRAMDAGGKGAQDVVKHAGDLVYELRTSKLSPQNYYDLYISVTDELRHLAAYFEDEESRRSSMSSHNVGAGRIEEMAGDEDDDIAGVQVPRLYEIVQYAGNIIPRLYLLITAGACAISGGAAPALPVLNDLLEMCKGVQHPTRGLFLRAYLLSLAKDRLPDDEAESAAAASRDAAAAKKMARHEMAVLQPNETAMRGSQVTQVPQQQSVSNLEQDHSTEEDLGVSSNSKIDQQRHADDDDDEQEHLEEETAVAVLGGAVDSVEFLLRNLGESTRLWVRLQHQGSVRDRARRQRERQNLRMLVGTNLVRLSQLEAVDLITYRTTVLPRVLELVGTSKDKLAQEYLMDVLIQVFPDEFHLDTLEDFLHACSQLQSDVRVNDILTGLMNRLAAYCLLQQQQSKQDEDDEAKRRASNAVRDDMFPLFAEHTAAILPKIGGDHASATRLALLTALANFAAKVYASRLDFIDQVLERTATLLDRDAPVSSGAKRNSSSSLDPKAARALVQLLTVPLETMGARILELQHYARVLERLDLAQRKQVAHQIVRGVLADPKTRITSTELLATLLEYIAPLLRDFPDSGTPPEIDAFDMDAEQHDLALLIHRVRPLDDDQSPIATQFALSTMLRQAIARGGATRLSYTIQPLLFGLLRLVPQAAASTMSAEANMPDPSKLLEFAHGAIALLGPLNPPLAIRLFLQASLVADSCDNQEEMVYELVSQAFITYEEEVAETRAQRAAVLLFTATVQRLTSLGPENFETISTKVIQYSARLLRKKDQVALIIDSCAPMFFYSCARYEFGRGKKVLTCFQRALKIANNLLHANEKATLFVDILTRVLLYYERSVDEVSAEIVSNAIELVQSHVADVDDHEPGAELVRSRLERALNDIRSKQQSGHARFSAIVISN